LPDDTERDADYFQALHTRYVRHPGGGKILVHMEQWYWESLDWMTRSFGTKPQDVAAFGLRHYPEEDFTEVLKVAIRVLIDSFVKIDEDKRAASQAELAEALCFFGYETLSSRQALQDKYLDLRAKIHPDFEPDLRQAYDMLYRHCQ
jgi:hypothetical protein